MSSKCTAAHKLKRMVKDNNGSMAAIRVQGFSLQNGWPRTRMRSFEVGSHKRRKFRYEPIHHGNFLTQRSWFSCSTWHTMKEFFRSYGPGYAPARAYTERLFREGLSWAAIGDSMHRFGYSSCNSLGDILLHIVLKILTAVTGGCLSVGRVAAYLTERFSAYSKQWRVRRGWWCRTLPELA